MPKIPSKIIKTRFEPVNKPENRIKQGLKVKYQEDFEEIKQKQKSMKEQLSQILGNVQDIRSNMEMLIKEPDLTQDISNDEGIDSAEETEESQLISEREQVNAYSCFYTEVVV